MENTTNARKVNKIKNKAVLEIRLCDKNGKPLIDPKTGEQEKPFEVDEEILTFIIKQGIKTETNCFDMTVGNLISKVLTDILSKKIKAVANEKL